MIGKAYYITIQNKSIVESNYLAVQNDYDDGFILIDLDDGFASDECKVCNNFDIEKCTACNDDEFINITKRFDDIEEVIKYIKGNIECGVGATVEYKELKKIKLDLESCLK